MLSKNENNQRKYIVTNRIGKFTYNLIILLKNQSQNTATIIIKYSYYKLMNII